MRPLTRWRAFQRALDDLVVAAFVSIVVLGAFFELIETIRRGL